MINDNNTDNTNNDNSNGNNDNDNNNNNDVQSVMAGLLYRISPCRPSEGSCCTSDKREQRYRIWIL